MIFTVTERGVFRRCRRQAVLTSKNGRHLGRLFPPLNLSVGTIVHRAHQLWLENPHKTMYACAMDASIEASKGVRERYLKQVGAYPSDDEMSVTHEAIDFALTMCENYELKYGTPLPPDYTLIKAEQKIRVAVPGTEHPCPKCRGGTQVRYVGGFALNECEGCLEDHPGTQVHYLEGKVDGLIQHSSGRIDVLEHKTYGNRPKQEDLQSNDQFIAYLWLVGQLGFNPHLDSCVAYDGMWRRKAVPRGRTFDDLFARYTLTRSPAELEEFERFLPLELNDMAAQYAHPDTAYINRPWDKPSCWDCGVSELCTAMSRDETDHIALLLQTKYTERHDDTEAEVEEEVE